MGQATWVSANTKGMKISWCRQTLYISLQVLSDITITVQQCPFHCTEMVNAMYSSLRFSHQPVINPLEKTYVYLGWGTVNAAKSHKLSAKSWHFRAVSHDLPLWLHAWQWRGRKSGDLSLAKGTLPFINVASQGKKILTVFSNVINEQNAADKLVISNGNYQCCH